MDDDQPVLPPEAPPSEEGGESSENSETAVTAAADAAEASFSGILPGAPVEPPPVVSIPGAPSRRSEPPVPSGPSGKPRREEERARVPRGPKPDLANATEPVYRERGGYRLRLEPADLARLRELPGSKGKTDRELGEAFFDGQSERFVVSLAEDVPTPADVRVVVDPYSRQAFLAVERKIRSILSF